jgi:transglutaminase-like putative cysteine protease
LRRLRQEFATYAAKSFTPGRPLLKAALALCHRIITSSLTPRATTATTPVRKVLKTKQGVCQDLAHCFIACPCSLGLPERYFRGPLRSGPNSIGAASSHVWVATLCPGYGWFDFDPTNHVMPVADHVTVGRGDDYSSARPVKGVALGGGDKLINVAAEIVPVAAAGATAST